MPKEFKDQDEFLDALFDHILGEDGEADEEYGEWFDTTVASFFREESGGSGNDHPRRKRQGQQGNTGSGSGSGSSSGSSTRRAMPPRRKSRSSSGYGSSAWFT